MLWLSSVVLCMSSVSLGVSLSVPPTHFCICDYLVENHFLPCHHSLLSLRVYSSSSYTSFHQKTFCKAQIHETVNWDWREKGVFLEPLCVCEASTVWNFKPLGLVTVEQGVCVRTSWQCWVYMRICRQWWTLTLTWLCRMTRNAALYWRTACEQRTSTVFKKCCLTKGPSQRLKWTPTHPPVCSASY